MTEANAKTIEEMLPTMIKNRASDLHLKVGSPPMLRIDGELRPLKLPPLTPEDTQGIVDSVTTEKQRRDFEEKWELDFGFGVPGLARFRVNAFRQRGSTGVVFRVIPVNVADINELGLPPILRSLALKPQGLVLVTGPTGSGKSTTLAAMVDHINRNVRCHIVTLEDPIEFLHQDRKSIINQREIGSDSHSFAEALKHVLRQDPDVILVGEMRDLETIALALNAAETGHLVLSTLHTSGAAGTINRVIDVFPADQQEQIRVQLSLTLEAVISQTLLPKVGGGRICAVEIMTGIHAIRNLIREQKIHQIQSIIETSSKDGMISLNQYLKFLCERELITFDDAVARATSYEAFMAVYDSK